MDFHTINAVLIKLYYVLDEDLRVQIIVLHIVFFSQTRYIVAQFNSLTLFQQLLSFSQKIHV